MNTIQQKIGSALKKQRNKLGMSAEKLAEATGATRLTIHRIESGEFLPNTLLLVKMAESLDLKISILDSDGENIINNL